MNLIKTFSFYFSGYNSDIICLQEVDCRLFNNFLQPIMASEGLGSSFYKKGKEVAEGLACFYRKDRFKYAQKFLSYFLVYNPIYLTNIFHTYFILDAQGKKK